MKSKYKKSVSPPWCSSYRGRVHIQGITTRPRLFSGKKVLINSVCAGHVIVDESDMFESDVQGLRRKETSL